MEEFEAEAFIRLGDYSQLSALTQKTEETNKGSWYMNLAHALVNFSDPQDDVLKIVNNLRDHLLDTTHKISIEMGSYQEQYSTIVR